MGVTAVMVVVVVCVCVRERSKCRAVFSWNQFVCEVLWTQVLALLCFTASLSLPLLYLPWECGSLTTGSQPRTILKYWLHICGFKTPNLKENKNYSHLIFHSLPKLMVRSGSFSSFFSCLGSYKKYIYNCLNLKLLPNISQSIEYKLE